MKILSKIFLLAILLTCFGCEKFLDRPQRTAETDETAWTSEEKLRLYANQYYTTFFTGYGNGFSTGGAPLMDYTNNDDVVRQGQQSNFARAVPNSSIWSYSTIRSLNIMLDRIETRMGNVLSADAKAHWIGVGRFYRGFRYAELVESYGDVPYYDREVLDNELDELYKPRTARNEVMDGVYDDWKFAMENVRLNDGNQNLNRYIVAGFVSRLALKEASWQKYYYHNNERAKKFFELAVEAANMVINSGRYSIVSDYKSLFTSTDLSTKSADVILYRNYDPAVGLTHAIASYSNLQESIIFGASTDLIKSYICADGKPWEVSAVEDADVFSLDNLIKTRDSRFEATFYSKPDALNKGSLYYITKFFPRAVETLIKEKPASELTDTEKSLIDTYKSDRNDTDAPVLRYAEVLLNWIEAKAELATLGGAAVTQDEINKSINAIRDRPLAEEAVERGVQKTAHLNIGAIPNDPNRDADVPALLWEIRRERRMEFAFEIFRLSDLKRWSKLEYLDSDVNEDLLSGGWVNFSNELPTLLSAANVGVLAVLDKDGTEKVYNGNNAADMKGFYKNTTNLPRLPFLNQPNMNPYLSPVGIVQMDQYASRGYELKQTEGWPQN